jgi:hypothetical protein
MRAIRLFCILLIASIFIINPAARAQLVEVPAVVKTAFDKKFPGAKEVDWLHNIGKPEVKFKYDDKDYWARFNKKGIWEASSVKITIEELPSEVLDGFHKSKYADWPVKELNKIQKPGGVSYKINVSKAALNSKNLLFDEKGRLLKDNYTI